MNRLEEFQNITKKALNFVFLLALPLTVYFTIFAKQGIMFLSGDAYTSAVVPMKVIMPTLLLIGITNVLGIQILVPTGREKYVLYSEIGGAVVDLVFNSLLIPRMQSTGAAIGTLAAEIVVFIIQYYFLRETVGSAFLSIKYYKIIIALTAGTVSSVWVLLLTLNSFVSLVISAVCFFGIYGVVLYCLNEKLVVEILGQVLDKLRRRI